MNISGIALPDIHISVHYFGSRRFDRSVDRKTAPWPCWILHWNQTPTATLRFQDRFWRLPPTVLSLVAPRTIAHETFGIGEECTYLHFNLGPRYDRVESRALVLPARGAIRTLLKELSDDYRRKDRLDPVDEFGVHALIALVLREIPPSFWPRPPADPRIQAALKTMDQRFGEPLDNAQLAKQAGLATSSFLRIFRQGVGEPPQRYLACRRFEQAALMLAQTDRSIEDIAAACGFCDRNYFTACFKRHYNCGPAAYRRSVARLDES
jgi:AraC-like DNA-binding protein